MLISRRINDLTQCSRFSTAQGSSEHFIAIHSRTEGSFNEALDEVLARYQECVTEEGLTNESQVFTRFYVSDIANQKNLLLKSALFDLCRSAAYSIVQQCPLDGSKLSILAYHTSLGASAHLRKQIHEDDRSWRNALKVTGRNYELLWSGNYCGHGSLDSRQQTNEIFSAYSRLIDEHGMSLLNNAIRTWIYVRDIDNHYVGMVNSRAGYFSEHGLTQDTRYIASTGIEAKLEQVNTLVAMDALSIANLKPAQIVRMEAPAHMSPTSLYGVTFERGSRVDFGDRSHFYISGTASIDSKGNVLHPGDVTKQTLRALENIDALLNAHGGSLRDMAYFIVYLRDITDVGNVKRVLSEAVPAEIPMILVEGSVCRPGWLVEIEGVGIKDAHHPYPDFC